MKTDIETTRGQMCQALVRAWKRIEIEPATPADLPSDEAANPEALPHNPCNGRGGFVHALVEMLSRQFPQHDIVFGRVRVLGLFQVRVI